MNPHQEAAHLKIELDAVRKQAQREIESLEYEAKRWRNLAGKLACAVGHKDDDLAEHMMGFDWPIGLRPKAYLEDRDVEALAQAALEYMVRHEAK